jgi:hypothetical protein
MMGIVQSMSTGTTIEQEGALLLDADIVQSGEYRNKLDAPIAACLILPALGRRRFSHGGAN